MEELTARLQHVRAPLRLVLLLLVAGAALMAPSQSYAQVCAIKPGTSNVPLCQSPGAKCTEGGTQGGAPGVCQQLSDECQCRPNRPTPTPSPPPSPTPIPTFTIGANVSGLTSGTFTLVLNDNGSSTLQISSNGATSTRLVANDSHYNVTIQSQPSGQSCGRDASGTVVGANVIVPITCFSTSAWTSVGPAPVEISAPNSLNAGRVNMAVADPPTLQSFTQQLARVVSGRRPMQTVSLAAYRRQLSRQLGNR